MIVRATLRSLCDPNESPPIQLSGEACKFAVFKIQRHYSGRELAFLQDNESLAVGQPCNDVRDLTVGENFHELRDRT